MTYRSNKNKNTELERDNTRSSFSWIEKMFFVKLVIWIAALLSFYLLSNRYWLWNFFSFIPPILFYLVSLIFVISVIIYILLKNQRRREYFFVFLLTLISLVLSIPLSDISLKFNNNNETGEFSIFNFNTEFWEDKDDIEGFISFLKSQDADIYHLQEFIAERSINGLNEETIEETFNMLKAEFPDYEIVQSSEFITMTRFPIFEYYEFADEKFLRNDIWVGNTIVSFYNVHIPVHIDTKLRDNIGMFFSDMKDRFYWREEVFEYLKQNINDNSRPVIVSGDFNTTSSMRSMNELFKFTNDAKVEAGTPLSASWKLFGLRLWRIDYVLGNDVIDFKTYKVVDSKSYSDHLAQRVTFKLK